MRFGFIGSRPLHLVPLSSLPLHTLLFPLFFHVRLSSCLVISSFSSFARTLFPALVCTCTSTYILTQASGCPGLYNEVGFNRVSLCTWFPFHFNHTHLCPVSSSVMSSFSYLLCTHMCTFALNLVYASCAPCSHRDSFELFCFLLHQQGDHPCGVSDGPTKRPQYMRISGLISQTYLQ